MKSGDHGNGTENPTRRTKQRGITENEELMVRAVLATFRYGGVPSYRAARVVAPEIGVSQQALRALLKAAFEKGLVSTLINLPQERIDVARLEEAARARYGLRRVRLVPGLPEILEELDQRRRRSLQTEVIQAMAQRVAEHLDELVAAANVRQRAAAAAGKEVEPFVIDVAWGRTMNIVA